MKLKLNQTWMACIYLGIIVVFDWLLNVVIHLTPMAGIDLAAPMYEYIGKLEDANWMPHSTYIPAILTMVIAVVVIIAI